MLIAGVGQLPRGAMIAGAAVGSGVLVGGVASYIGIRATHGNDDRIDLAGSLALAAGGVLAATGAAVVGAGVARQLLASRAVGRDGVAAAISARAGWLLLGGVGIGAVAGTLLAMRHSLSNSAQRRADEAFSRIDPAAPAIAVVVPPTFTQGISGQHRRVIERLQEELGHDVSAVDVPYPTLPAFPITVPDGAHVLRLLLDRVKRELPDRDVYLIGHSQGALVIRETLRNDDMRDLVTRAVFFGHPGWADDHFHGTPPPANHDPTHIANMVVEINHEEDFVPALLARRMLSPALWVDQIEYLLSAARNRDVLYWNHYYGRDAQAAAHFLATGDRSQISTFHRSDLDP